MDFYTVSFLLIAVGIIVIIFAIYKAVTIQVAYNSIKDCFSSNDGTLYLNSKGVVWKKFIKIRKVKNSYLGYEPEKLHFGSATVGGVTSGGFYTTGGYNKVVASSDSGKCELEFTGDANMLNKTIRVIKLSNELYEEAQKANIAKYLNPTTKSIEMFDKVIRTKGEVDALINNAMKLATGVPLTSGMAIDDTRGFPTYQKCKEILDWMSEK